MSGLIATIDRHPQAVFAGFLVLHLAVWTLLPALLYPNLPLDLIEALTYGREWQLGYDKLPPLPWWLVEVVYRVFGVDAAYYALAQAAVVAAFALVWATALPLVGAARRAGRGADRRRPALLPFHRREVQSRRHPTAVLGARRLRVPRRAAARPHARTGACSGSAIGIALWAKYFVVVLAVPFALFLLFDRDARKALATPGPWVARRRSRSRSWRRISSGWCRTISCRSPMRARAPRPRAG